MSRGKARIETVGDGLHVVSKDNSVSLHLRLDGLSKSIAKSVVNDDFFAADLTLADLLLSSNSVPQPLNAVPLIFQGYGMKPLYFSLPLRQVLDLVKQLVSALEGSGRLELPATATSSVIRRKNSRQARRARRQRQRGT